MWLLIRIRTNTPGNATQLTKGVLDLGVDLRGEHLPVLIGHIRGINIESMEHPFPSPLCHGSNTAMGGRLRALRNDDVFWAPESPGRHSVKDGAPFAAPQLSTRHAIPAQHKPLPD